MSSLPAARLRAQNSEALVALQYRLPDPPASQKVLTNKRLNHPFTAEPLISAKPGPDRAWADGRLTKVTQNGWACEEWRTGMAVDHSMKVLVVDDYKTMIRIIRNLLKQLGFANVDEASDGSSALNMMRQNDYGLVISDWNMEPMTGYELLREMRADDRLSHTPFIMVTAESKTDNVIAAKKAGVNNYIVKPFNAATLKAKIDAIFGE
jgi:two-component system chemotaxis response regulator CheY